MAANSETIRVAILCKGLTFEAWEAESIRQVMSLPFVEIVLLVAEANEEEAAPSFAEKLRGYPYRNLLWRVYKRVKLRTPSTAEVSLANELKHVPLIHCRPELRGKFSQHFSSADLDIIRSHRPDVILRFGFNILRGEILSLAKYGVWSFHHADPQTIRGGPAAFWEIYNRVPFTGAILQRLTEKLDAGIVLREGYFRTQNRSYRANFEQLANGTTGWMKQALLDVKHSVSPAENGTPLVSSAPVHHFPRNGQMLRAWRITRANKIRFHLHSLFKPEKWTVAKVQQSQAELLRSGLSGKIEWLPEAPAGEYYADPFGWMENGEPRIIFEHYRYRNNKGHLSLLKRNSIETFVRYEHHLSYPFVHHSAHGIRIMPECFESGNLLMFDEQDSATPKVIMKDFIAVDPTLLEHNGKWWLFCTKADIYSNTELFIYHSNSPEGDWQPHANNPVKCDIRSSRPAGTPFKIDGKIYRPAQDCSTTYGAAVAITEITALSETTFSERIVRRIEPQPGWKFNSGLHTVSIIDDSLLVIDAKRYAFNFDNFKSMLGRKLRRLAGK
jgi:hypothetical protein